MLACSFLFESSSKLLVTRTGIKAWSSSNLVQIRQLILELLALEWWKFHTFELEYLWSEVANLDQILCVASLGWGKGCIRFWGWLTLARWTQVSDRCPLGYLFLFCHEAAHLFSMKIFVWFCICLENEANKDFWVLNEISQLMRLWYSLYRQTAKAQARLSIRAVSPEPSLFAHIKYGSRRRVWPKIRCVAPLDCYACVFEDRVYRGR